MQSQPLIRQLGEPELSPNPPRLCRTDMGGRPGLLWDLGVPEGPAGLTRFPTTTALDPGAIPSAPPPRAGRPSLTVLPLCWGSCPCGAEGSRHTTQGLCLLPKGPPARSS